MKRFFSLEYWLDDGWYVGRLKEVPGVFSQGATLAELKENIADAYRMMLDTESEPEHAGANTLEVGVEV
jgi:predicted RNase H-like HicB family nuclease